MSGNPFVITSAETKYIQAGFHSEATSDKCSLGDYVRTKRRGRLNQALRKQPSDERLQCPGAIPP